MTRHSRSKGQCICGVEMVEGPMSLAQSRTSPDGGLDVANRQPHSFWNVFPFSQLACNGRFKGAVSQPCGHINVDMLWVLTYKLTSSQSHVYASCSGEATRILS